MCVRLPHQIGKEDEDDDQHDLVDSTLSHFWTCRWFVGRLPFRRLRGFADDTISKLAGSIGGPTWSGWLASTRTYQAITSDLPTMREFEIRSKLARFIVQGPGWLERLVVDGQSGHF